MLTPRKLVVILAVLLATALAACGHPTHHHAAQPAPKQPVPGHPCTPGNFYMQCANPQGGIGRPPLAALPVFAYGIDFGWSCPNAHSLGAVFGASYLSTDGSKNWTRACVNSYHAQGLATVNVWETAAARASAGYYAGRSDAQTAGAQAAYLGEPANRPIYFAVDYDTSLNPGAIVSYFRGIDSIRGPPRTGAYGGLATMRVLFGDGLIRYGWQTAAWSYGVWDGRAQIQQYSFGAALDWNRALAHDYGQWPYATPAPPSPPIAFDFWQRCSRLDAITFWKLHGGHGHVSPAQHQQAVRIRKWLTRNKIGCSAPPHSYPYRYPKRPGALA